MTAPLDADAPSDDGLPRLERPWSGPSPWVVAAGLGVVGIVAVVGLGVNRARLAQHHGVSDLRQPAYVSSVPSLEIPPREESALTQASPAPRIVYVDRPGPPVIQYVNRPEVPASNANPDAQLAQPVLPIDLSKVAAGDQAASADAPAEANVMHNSATLVPQGALIPAVIETAADSSQPGLVRAVTTGDTRGFDGTRVLIPRGSHVVGEIHADGKANQVRVPITWTRLIRPDGVTISFSAPSTDLKGKAGVEGHVDDHLAARIADAALQSVLTVGVALASRPGNGSVVIGVPAQTAAGSITQAGDATGQNTPTITVREGTPIMIFVNRDLDFTGAVPRK